jgi:hypothetical protein
VNADEAVLPVPDPQVSSNFVIDLTGSTMLSGVYVFEFAIVNDELVLNDNVEIICE